MTKKDREELEHRSQFSDERYAKKAWKELIGKSLDSASAVLPDVLDAKGNPILASVIYDAARRQVIERLSDEGLDRDPTKAEIIVEANIIRAAMDTQVFNTILDRTAGKVKEEISIGRGAFEDLTDEELEILAAHRAAKGDQE